ncbi:hypothetical protein ACFE04_001845 [Oxalis oulophora]
MDARFNLYARRSEESHTAYANTALACQQLVELHEQSLNLAQNLILLNTEIRRSTTAALENMKLAMELAADDEMFQPVENAWYAIYAIYDPQQFNNLQHQIAIQQISVEHAEDFIDDAIRASLRNKNVARTVRTAGKFIQEVIQRNEDLANCLEESIQINDQITNLRELINESNAKANQIEALADEAFQALFPISIKF